MKDRYFFFYRPNLAFSRTFSNQLTYRFDLLSIFGSLIANGQCLFVVVDDVLDVVVRRLVKVTSAVA